MRIPARGRCLLLSGGRRLVQVSRYTRIHPPFFLRTVEIAKRPNPQTPSRMLRKRMQHMIQKPDPCVHDDLLRRRELGGMFGPRRRKSRFREEVGIVVRG